MFCAYLPPLLVEIPPSICFMRLIVCFHENFPGSTFLWIKPNNWRRFSAGVNHKQDSDYHVLYFATYAQLIPIKGENFLLLPSLFLYH